MQPWRLGTLHGRSKSVTVHPRLCLRGLECCPLGLGPCLRGLSPSPGTPDFAMGVRCCSPLGVPNAASGFPVGEGGALKAECFPGGVSPDRSPRPCPGGPHLAGRYGFGNDSRAHSTADSGRWAGSEGAALPFTLTSCILLANLKMHGVERVTQNPSCLLGVLVFTGEQF